MGSHTYGQLIFAKVAKTIEWGINSLSTNGFGTTGYAHAIEWS